MICFLDSVNMLLCIRHYATDRWNLRVGMQFELQYKTNIWIHSCRGRYFSHVETSEVGMDNGYEMFRYFGPDRCKNCL